MAEQIETPATAIVVSSSGTGDGQYVETPTGGPDLIIRTVTPLVAIFVRAAKSYLQTLTGLLGAAGLGMASSVLPAGDFFATLQVCAGLSVASFVMSVLTNTTVLLTVIGEKFPVLRA